MEKAIPEFFTLQILTLMSQVNEKTGVQRMKIGF
jgi:hypothetical protein